jgi:hypothetical protein
MMENARQLIPAARIDELIIQEVESETLVYDLKSHKAHCLNRTAALVWKNCDGKRTVEQVARKVEAELGEKVSPEVVWLAVNQLEKRSLLEEPVKMAYGAARMSRREVARRLGIVTALVALPLITSINAPAAIQAVSGCGSNGATCGGANPPCCPPLGCNPFTNQCANL